jgi:hypothetical protein
MEPTREQKLAQSIGDLVKTYSFDKEAFCKAMDREHNTNQQQFAGIVLAWIQHCGSPDFYFDGRNKYTHEVFEKISKFMKENEISDWTPMI